MSQGLPYRPGVGVMLLDRDGGVFVARRLDNTAEAWQMPQGGLDAGEEPLEGARRELWEETGIAPEKTALLAACEDCLRYDLPVELQGKIWGGRYRGQEQHWFLMRFLGHDSDIDLNTHEPPEFSEYKWIAPAELPQVIVPFKRTLYRELLQRFAAHLEDGQCSLS